MKKLPRTAWAMYARPLSDVIQVVERDGPFVLVWACCLGKLIWASSWGLSGPARELSEALLAERSQP